MSLPPPKIAAPAPVGPVQHRLRSNGCELAYYERYAELRDSGPTLLFVHATGFHARVWDQVIARLPRAHSIALDQRGHGRSEKTRISHWQIMGQDQAALVEELALEGIVGVGHSMGAHAMIDAAAMHPTRFRRLLLIDPTVAAPEAYSEGGDPPGHGQMHPAAKRRNRFDSVEAMIARLRDRSSFPLFDPQIFRDYCEHGLVPAENGDGFVLACPPEVEASVYMSSRTNGGVHESARSLEIPVLVLRAKRPSGDMVGPMAFSTSPTWPGLAAEFKHGREIHFPDKTHFLPMEIPDEVAALIRTELEAAS
ncbi:MAG: alpha/beta hydrolase [Proteobacteria bacterium]|nr:alpha/beta hydrolase [Pseudomonadota bacterium]